MIRQAWQAGVAAALVAVAGVAASRGATDVDVETAWVTRGSITHETTATGALEAATTVDVGAPIAGVVQSVDADDNALVHAGDIVARIDPAPYDAELRSARAALAAAQAEARNLETAEAATRSVLVRDEELAAEGQLAKMNVDEAREADVIASAAAATAQSAAQHAEDAVKAAELDVERTVVRSPVDGVVLLRTVAVGENLSAATQAPILFRIAVDVRHLQVIVDLSAADAADVRSGDRATFTVAQFGSELFSGVVSDVRTHPARTAIVEVANADERLRPGMMVNVTLHGRRHDDVTRVPNAAFAFQPPIEAAPIVDEVEADAGADWSDLRQVWKFSHGRLTPVAIRTGLSDGEWSELVYGSLEPDDELATGVKARRVSWLSRAATWLP